MTMRKLLIEAYLLLGEKDPKRTADSASDTTDSSQGASNSSSDSSSSPPDGEQKGQSKKSKAAYNIASKIASKRAQNDDHSVHAMVARVKRLRDKYTERERDQEKLAPSIAAATNDAKGHDLFQPNPNSTPSHRSVTDLTKGW